MLKTVVCDLDGVLCSEERTFEHSVAIPYQDQIDAINRLFDTKRVVVIIHTARGWGEFTMTQRQLVSWGVKYHTLICGKPIADIVIDDRSVTTVDDALEKLK